MLASRLLQHHESLLLLCVCHALPPLDHGNMNIDASIESLVSHPATAAGTKSLPIGADAEAHKPPCTLVERGVQSAGRRARSVGCWVRLAAVDRPRQVGCMLPVYMPCNSHALKTSQSKGGQGTCCLLFMTRYRTILYH
jgi:hypothetical protein